MADTSALVALLQGEPEAGSFAAVIDAADRVIIGAPTKFEFMLVSESLKPAGGADDAKDLLRSYNILVEQWTDLHADLAIDALRGFGKGRHPAKLNFGDCMTYAVAKASQAPLLFQGSDVSKTDIEPAL